jgi:ribosomal protein L11 methylase PrmA
VVYDLGSGDGRLVITAAKKYGARGVGVEIDPQLVRLSRENARKAGVSERVRFVSQDLFKTDLGPATVVTLYLRPEVNLRLRPKLLRELRPGARVVSNTFDMGDWKPDVARAVGLETIYYWAIPPRSGNTPPRP